MEQNIYNAIYKVNHAGGCGSCFYLKQYDKYSERKGIAWR